MQKDNQKILKEVPKDHHILFFVVSIFLLINLFSKVAHAETFTNFVGRGGSFHNCGADQGRTPSADAKPYEPCSGTCVLITTGKAQASPSYELGDCSAGSRCGCTPRENGRVSAYEACLLMHYQAYTYDMRWANPSREDLKNLCYGLSGATGGDFDIFAEIQALMTRSPHLF